jgi:hypothetical protein
MGMFDTVYINSSLLPVTAQEQERLRKIDFQTKSLDSRLADVYITDEGYLEMVDSPFMADGDSDNEEGKPLYKRYRLADATGQLDFYTSLDDQWYQFQATFDEGKLIRIKKISPNEPSRYYHGDTCLWSMMTEIGTVET